MQLRNIAEWIFMLPDYAKFYCTTARFWRAFGSCKKNESGFDISMFIRAVYFAMRTNVNKTKTERNLLRGGRMQISSRIFLSIFGSEVIDVLF